MRQDIRVLDRVRGAYASLRPSEQRVADYVLKDPETCTRCTISELADQVQVSQPTVIRFVQALGFDGYRNFKYCLIRDRSGGAAREACFDHLGGFDLKPWDQLEDLPLKEVRVSGGLLEEALKSLSVQELDRAVRMLATARTIDIYGVENSCTPASALLPDAHRRLSPADRRRPSGGGRRGGSLFPLRLLHGYGEGAETGQKGGGKHHRRHQSEESSLGQVRRRVPVYRGRGHCDLRHSHLLPHPRSGGGGSAVHGDHSERL